ncbi:MAG: ATP-dependent DNA helicase [Alphaproteobacteria bacterium]|nr:ATP-dependent DNA helicase [Alphaproteobacteria bacterium]MCB9690771.1 ATP-dependent DNA helicase [Alphaproteobacteria bacterium]
MIRYDDEERTLTLSVRDLVTAGEPRGHLTLEVVRAQRSRLVAGQQAHVAWQDERAAEDPHFSAEVTVRRREVVAGWTVTVQGRVDGLVEGDGHWVVEEVKSTALDIDRLYPTGRTDWPDYVAQLEVYLWMVARDRPAHQVSGRLILVSLADGSRHVIGVAADPDRVEREVHAKLEDLVAAREERIAWMGQRRQIPVRWPFPEQREGQAEVRRAVASGLRQGRPVLVEAPTGLGKTAAVLTEAVRSALETDRQVFWATTRTTQQPVVLQTLERLAAAGTPLRAVVLNARGRVCLHRGPDGVAQVDCRPEVCRFADRYFDKLRETGVVREAREGRAGRERLEALALQHEVCPYQLARDAVHAVDVVIGDLNYVLEPGSRVREIFDVDPSRWIVVADEAHQLVERARAYRSPRLAASQAVRAAEFLEGLGEAFAPFAFLARQIEDLVVEAGLQVVGPVRGEEGVADLAIPPWRDMAERVDEIGLDYALLKAERQTPDAEDPWLDLARSVLRFVGVLAELDEASVVIVEGGHGREAVRVCCLDPSGWLGPQIRRLGGFVAASATLRPVDFQLDLVGLRGMDPVLVDVPSPFPPENQLVVVAPRVSTAWRDRKAHAAGTAELLASCIEAVPGNVAVFFSSFAMLEDLAGRWDLPDRDVLLQPRSLSEGERSAWLAGLAGAERPVVLAAVLGGIFAEGVDLPPGALSAVLVCGPAFPPVGLERDLLREVYEQRYGAGFLYASLVPGMTKVVQAAGRLIRRPEDRGAVVLVGRRFRWRDLAELLPAHWDASVEEEPADVLAPFFRPGEAGFPG